MLGGAGADERQVARGGLCEGGGWAREAAAAKGGVWGWGRDGREERVRVEGGRVWDGGHGGAVRGERVAGDEDVLVAGAAAFGRDDVRVVGGRDFVDDADEAVGPGWLRLGVAVAVVFVLVGRRGAARGGGGDGGIQVAVGGVGEARLGVGEARQVEGHAQGGHDHVRGGEGPDAAAALEGRGAEVGAVREVEDCELFVGRGERSGFRRWRGRRRGESVTGGLLDALLRDGGEAWAP